MDSNKRKYVPGILVMTLIFLGLSIFAVSNMFKNNEEKKHLVSGSYISLLNQELNLKLDGETEFEVFDKVGYDLVVMPKKYEKSIKPCFDFVVVRDGIIIKNLTSKEFLKYPIELGSKIVKIDEKELIGLSYFEILDLVYASSNNITKKFTLSDGTSFDYLYERYSGKEEINVEDGVATIKLFNLDEVSRKGLYDKISSYEKVVIDLSNATVNTLDGMKIFMSFFSSGNEELFSIPSGIKSLETYKIKNAEINIGNNKDNGILFMMSSLKLLNSNLKITGLSTIRNEFKTYKILENADYKIYIYNYEFKSRSASSTGSGVLT